MPYTAAGCFTRKHMTFSDSVQLELIKAALTLGLAVLVLALGWFVGQRFAVHWAIRQKRRELELAAANQFYKLYGEFFSVWKLWNYSLGEDRPKGSPETTRWDLLIRASAAEAGVEAILMKLASERQLSEEEVDSLGKFRQAYQTLRETIGADRKLDWWSSQHHEYVSFKRLACDVVSMLSATDQARLPSALQASETLARITSNKWERRWALPESDSSDLPSDMVEQYNREMRRRRRQG